MNQCFGCSTCRSADKPLEAFIRSLPLETSHHRVEGQSVKCGFGLQGVCCRLCSNGPCRVTPKAPKGICGATADVIVSRNFLRAVAAGSGCYIHIVENTALNLKNTALAGGAIKGEKALDRLCGLFGVTAADKYDKALAVAEMVLADLYKPEYEKMALVNKLAYAPRRANWEKLGILPGGANAEIVKGVVKCSTNLNSDPVDMLLTCLKLGISTGLYGLTLTNLLNDVMLGEPEIRLAPVGLGVIDPDYINIMITGHQHSCFSYLQDRLTDPEVTAKAAAVGAKGFRLVGCTCVGQDLQLRGAHYEEVFVGHAGNNYTSEAVLATGALVQLADLPVNTIGDLYTISSSLPRPALPAFSSATVAAVLPDALTIAILAAIESLLSAVVADEMTGSRHNSNMELVAVLCAESRAR